MLFRSFNFFGNQESDMKYFPQYLKDFKIILQKNLDLMTKNQHNSKIITVITASLFEFSLIGLEFFDIFEFVEIIDSIYRSSKYDEINLKATCLTFLCKPEIFKKKGKEYSLSTVFKGFIELDLFYGKNVVEIREAQKMSEVEIEEIEETMKIGFALLKNNFMDDYSFYLVHFEYMYAYDRHWKEMKIMRENENSFDVKFNFN